MLYKASIALECHTRTVRFFKLEGERGMTRDVIFRRVDRRVAPQAGSGVRRSQARFLSRRSARIRALSTCMRVLICATNFTPSQRDISPLELSYRNDWQVGRRGNRALQ